MNILCRFYGFNIETFISPEMNQKHEHYVLLNYIFTRRISKLRSDKVRVRFVGHEFDPPRLSMSTGVI